MCKWVCAYLVRCEGVVYAYVGACVHVHVLGYVCVCMRASVYVRVQVYVCGSISPRE